MQNTSDLRRKAVDILGETTLATLLYAQRAVQPNGCWIWQGAKSAKGYGVLKTVLHGRLVILLTHNLAYRLWKGEVPKKHGLCHSKVCESLGAIGRACFNPSHLRPCTRAQNEADKKKV
jgi:hypothetical protein